jgi:NAD(P)-dependent dehydrogenase (short-subunit alcohol dehydrogenase family)
MVRTFGSTSTADDVLEGVELRGKRVLVTGVSAWLGVETARTLAAHGAEVVGAARDLNKARTATEQVRAQAASGGGLELVELDLASLTSVRACADALVSLGKPFDLIIANAGIMACPKGSTSDGFETQFGVNHLGHFVFVNRLVSLMSPVPVWSTCPRLVIVSRTSTWKIRTSSARPIPSLGRTGVRRPPISCSPSSSIGGTKRMAYARLPSIPASSGPNSAAT